MAKLCSATFANESVSPSRLKPIKGLAYRFMRIVPSTKVRGSEHVGHSNFLGVKLFRGRRHSAAAIAAALLTIVLFGAPCLSQEIISVEIEPVGPISSSNAVSFKIVLATSQFPAQLYRPTEVVVGRNQLLIVLYPTWGDGFSFDSLTEVVPVGPLPAGTYQYVIALVAKKELQLRYNQLFVTGSFAVIPQLESALTANGQIWLRWEASEDFVLQTREELAAAAEWKDVPYEPVPISLPYQTVTIEPAGSSAFFRLARRSP
jgi:hypothetical protein